MALIFNPDPMPVDVTAAVVVAGALVAAVDVEAEVPVLDMLELMNAFPVSLAALSANQLRT
jgi:hypothetical protein